MDLEMEMGLLCNRRSQVQSSQFKGILLSLILFVGYQILDETSNGSAGASGMIIHILKQRLHFVLHGAFMFAIKKILFYG